MPDQESREDCDDLNSLQVVSPAPTPLPVPRPSFWSAFTLWLWGYDYFISYHWKSGGRYAAALAQELLDRGFECFLDREEFAMGEDWREEARRALHHTQRLILVATREAATQSQPVEREVEIFTSRSNLVIPIVFGDRFTEEERERSSVLQRIRPSHLYIDESPERLDEGPSLETIDKIIRTHRVLRRRTLRTRIAGTAIAVLGAAFIIAGLFWCRAEVALENETKEHRIATCREYMAKAESLREKFPELSVLMALHAVSLFDGTNQAATFEAHAQLFNSLERLSALGLGREDGTVQVARIDGSRLYTAGVVSNVLRIRDLSPPPPYKALLALDLPVIRKPCLSRCPRRFSLSPDQRWLAVVGHSGRQEVALVDLVKKTVQPIEYRLPEESAEDNSDLNPPSDPVFVADSKAMFFIDRSCHLHSFHFGEATRWRHGEAVDLFPGTNPNPELRYVSHIFMRNRLVWHVRSAESPRKIHWIDLTRISRGAQVLHTIEPRDGCIELASAGDTLYAWELNGKIPFMAWRLEPTQHGLGFTQIALKGLDSTRRLVRILAVSPSGRRVVGCSSTGGSFVYSIENGGIQELPKGLDRASFLGRDSRLITVQTTKPSHNDVHVTLWHGDQAQGNLQPSDTLTLTGQSRSIVSSVDGTRWALSYWTADGVKNSLFESDDGGHVIRREDVPLWIAAHSSDLRFLSSDARFWDHGRSALMRFVWSNRIPGLQQGSPIHRLPRNRVVFRRSESASLDAKADCLLGTIRDDGTVSEDKLLCKDCVEVAVSETGSHGVVADRNKCEFWSLDAPTPKPLATVPIPFGSSGHIRSIRVNAKGDLALVVAIIDRGEAANDDAEVWVLDADNPVAPRRIESVEGVLAVRTEWLTNNDRAIVSFAQPAPSAQGGPRSMVLPPAEEIVESTRVFTFNRQQGRPQPTKSQEISLGGQWIARSADRRHPPCQ